MKKIPIKIFVVILMYFLIILFNNIVLGTESGQEIEEGEYIIKSAVNENFVFDIYEGLIDDGTKLELWNNNKSENQRFNVKYIGNGEYTISALHSGKNLEVENNSKDAGAKIVQRTENNQDNQKWIIKAAEGGYYKIISKSSNLCLDIPYAEAKNGADVQIWLKNDGKNQMFKFEKQSIKEDHQEEVIIGTKTVEEGIYIIKSAINESFVFDIYEGLTKDGTKLELWNNNKSENQQFNVKYIGNGEYTISAVHSGKNLEVDNNSKDAGAKIVQRTENNQDNQKWIIKAVGGGYYKIISKSSNLCLDIPYAEAKNGADVQIWLENDGKNQMFKLEEQTYTIEDGCYNIKSLIDNESVLDIFDKSMKDGANLEIWGNNDGANQKFKIKYLDDGSYTISPAHSGKYIDVEGASKLSGTNVFQWSYNGGNNQKWKIKKISNNVYNIISKDSGLYLTVEEGNVCIREADNSNRQKFSFEKTTMPTNINIDSNRYPGYKEKLEALKNAHPNWNFELLYTGLNFEDVTSGECKVHSRNLVPSSYSGEWICPVCGTKLYDNGLYCASEKAVAYYMDPRNFLDDSNIFQFEDLNRYESSVHSLEGIKLKTSGTFLNDYSEDINNACINKNVNPYYIVARLIQEQGRKGTKIGTGMDGGDGKTYYNPFNIGASGNGYDQIYNNALAKAKSYGWDTMQKALEGGIDFCKKNWLENYQNTLYQNKFDIDTRNGTSLYTHQYMQNIFGAYSEAKTLRSMYSQTNCLDGYFTFIIPVYENMSSTISQLPASSSESNSLNVIVRANGGLKLRSGASTSSDVIEIIANGTMVLSVQRGIGDNWNKVITTDGKIGYMSGNYLEIIDTINNCNYTARVKTNDGSGCKVRIGPSINLDRLTTLSEGTEVTVIEKGTFNNIDGYDWCRIITPDGRQGYMPLRYLN